MPKDSTSPDRFDHLAESYDLSIPAVPDQYIQLMREICSLEKNDRILDLGCGTGTLTLALTEFSSFVQGVDISREMILRAQLHDIHKAVNWICTSVDEFDFGRAPYKLIVSYEAFHLFPDPIRLVRRSAKALAPGGFLCIGWVNFEWEVPLRDTLIDTFGEFGIDWSDWGYWSCPDFPRVVSLSGAILSPTSHRKISVESRTHIRSIATYLTSIDKVASLDEAERASLSDRLMKRFRVRLSSEWSVGAASYNITYCMKSAE